MRRQRASRFGAADEAVEDTVRETRLGTEGREEEGGERVKLGGLDDDRISARQSGRDLLS